MVKALRFGMAAACLAVALGACQVLFIGYFPPGAAQTTARADVSALIAPGPASSFDLARVTAGGREYILLFSGLGFDPAQVHLLVFDEHLKVLNTYTNSVLPSPVGGHPMTDVNGDVIIGSLLFTAQPGGLVSPVPSIQPISGPSVTGLPAYPNNEANFQLTGGNLAWDEYNAAWGGPIASPSVAMGGPPLSLSKVLTERDSGGMPDVFVLRDNSGNATYFLLIPKAHIDSGNIVAIVGVSDIFTVYGGAGLIKQKSDLDDSVGLAYGDVFAYDKSAQALIHFTLGDPNTVNSLPIKWKQGSKLAAGAGGFCVVWDPVSRTLTRYEKWW